MTGLICLNLMAADVVPHCLSVTVHSNTVREQNMSLKRLGGGG